MFKEPGLMSLLSTKEHKKTREAAPCADEAEGDLGFNCSCFVSPTASAVT